MNETISNRRPVYNKFKSSLIDGKLQVGLWLAFADAYVAEACATCGFDWLLIDGEHAPNDLRTMLMSLQAIAAYDANPVVRIPSGDETLIKQVLELGVTTLLVPMVNSFEDAEKIVRSMRYPPAGTRGVGSGIARSSRWAQTSNYVTTANDRICILVQAETEMALTNLDAILAVDGVDGVFIGPADLAASMGYLGQTNHPKVIEAVVGALTRIRRAGKAGGVLCTDEQLARKYIKAGATFVAVGTDTSLLVKSATDLANRFKQPLCLD